MANESSVPRRAFLQTVGGTAAAGLCETNVHGDETGGGSSSPKMDQSLPTTTISFRLNGKEIKKEIDCRTTLVDLLREDLGMVGTKKGCDHGSCGACTVHIDGRRVLSCLTLAATLDGTEVQSIEGLADGEELHPLQQAFLRCDAYQCGYCTPGQIMSGVACIEEGHAGGDVDETREWMSGNLCRCSAYPNITAAVRQTAGSQPARDPAEGVMVIHGPSPAPKQSESDA